MTVSVIFRFGQQPVDIGHFGVIEQANLSAGNQGQQGRTVGLAILTFEFCKIGSNSLSLINCVKIVGDTSHIPTSGFRIKYGMTGMCKALGSRDMARRHTNLSY